jgi:uncharacterized protein YjdB
MPSTKRKVQLFLAVTTLVLLAAAVGCRGFFVNPTLTTLTVGPSTPSIQQGSTLQMTATGTYDDGSTKTLTSGVYWQTSDDTTVSISNGGLIKGVNIGNATITAQSGTVSGSTTVTVSLANLVSITVTPTNPSRLTGQTVTFTAMGTVSGGSQYDITDSVTWTSSNTSVATMSSNVATTQGAGTTTITATSGSISGSTTLTVN